MSTAPRCDIDVEQFWRDPYPDLAAMRAEAPIAFVPQLGATLITTRDDIAVCEKNVAVFSSDQPGGLMNVLMGQNMMRRDGADHQAERRVYAPAMSPKQVRDVWAAQFGSHAARILDGLIEQRLERRRSGGSGAVDLVAAYAMPVSGEALKSMTGLTNITYADMDAWSQAMIDGIANYTGDPDVEARCHEATAAIDAAIDEMLPSARGAPGHDLLSVMVASAMPLENVRANIKLTISGGQNEPRDAIAGAVWALLTHPDQLALVRAGNTPWQQAFEEYCRWVAPIQMSPRRVAAEFEYGGVRFEPGERVFLMFGSANRDERWFDDPDRFDVTRDTKMALTFGAGPHFCAGAAASRSLVGDVALPMIFDRLDGLRLADGEDPVEFGGWAFRGPLSVPVAWG